MKKLNLFNNKTFLIQILILTIALYFIHFNIIKYLIKDFFTLPYLKNIYLFLCLTVLAFVFLLTHYSNKNPKKMLQTFLILSALKIILVVVFLLPLFLGKIAKVTSYVVNFFIPYFIYLVIEIKYSLLLLNTEK